MSLVKSVITCETKQKDEALLTIIMMCSHCCLDFLTKICNDWFIFLPLLPCCI